MMDFGLFNTWNALYAGGKVPWDPAYSGGKLLEEEAYARNFGDCSKDTGFIQPVPDGVRRGFVDGLRLGLHATYPVPSVH